MISICIASFQCYFFTRLAIEKIREYTHLVGYEIIVYDDCSTDETVSWLKNQGDVRLFEGDRPRRDHGWILDTIKKEAKGEVICFLDADAHPTSAEWITPAFKLYDGKTKLSGISFDAGRLVKRFVHPSYMFGEREFVLSHRCVANWPSWDTCERMTYQALKEGYAVYLIQSECNADSFGGRFTPKMVNYNNWVWHCWYASRITREPTVIGTEIEAGYHDVVKEMLRKKYGLQY